MRHRKILALLILVLLLLELGACGQPVASQTSDSSSSSISSSQAQETETDAQTVPAKEPIMAYVEGQDSIVSLVQSDTVEKAEDLTQEDIDALVRAAVEAAGGLEGIVKDGDTVVLKPNLVLMSDYTLPGGNGKQLASKVNGVTTDYRFTRAVAKLVRELNPSGKIYVVEGSAQDTKTVMQALNYTKGNIPEVDEFYGIEDISGGRRETGSDKLVRVTDDDFILHDEYYVTKLIYDADVYISLPTLKNHSNTTITGGIKNIGIGGTPANIYAASQFTTDRQGMVDHTTTDLYKWIADFYRARPADFVIMDGLQGIEHGPTPSYDLQGCTDIKDSQMNMRLVLAGSDAVAVDTVEADIMNWDFKTVGYLTYLNELGTGTTDARYITVTGNRSIDDVRVDFEGILPAIGGDKLKDKTPPTLSDVSSESEAGAPLKIHFTTDETAVKTEVYIDGVLAGKQVLTAGSSANLEMTVETTGLKSGAHKAEVVVYDEYFNSSSASLNITLS